MKMNHRMPARDTVRLGVLAGLAGGFAEILWIWLYGAVSGVDSGLVARGVSAAVGAGEAPSPLALGLVIHMALAVVLGVAMTLALRSMFARSPGTLGLYAGATLALAVVWVVNFHVLLPRISPAFIDLVPYPVSLLSKILFGLAAAAVIAARLGHGKSGAPSGDRAAAAPPLHHRHYPRPS